MPKKSTWKMPKWMEPYRDMIGNTGGNSIEDLMNDDGVNSTVFNNAPRALICVAVKSQVGLLYRMRDSAMLAKIAQPAPEVRRALSA